MKFLLQRVMQATLCCTASDVKTSIGRWIVVYMGIGKTDVDITFDELHHIACKLIMLKLFEDEAGKIKRSIQDVQGEMLLISNFTLCGTASKWTQMDFGWAAPFDIAKLIYDDFTKALAETSISLKTGVFGWYMEITSTVDGPVNVFIEW